MENSSFLAPIPSVSGEVKVTVTIFLNASSCWLEKPSKNLLPSHLVGCVVLGLLAITSIAMNFCLLMAIFCSSSLKKVLLNQFVSYVALSCLLDCTINAPLSLYYMKTNAWFLGTKICIVNAACVLLISFLVTWSVCCMCIERWFSLYKPLESRRFPLFCKQNVGIATSVIAGTAIVFPLGLGLVEVRAYPARFSCSVAVTEKDLYYRIIIIVCFALPIGLASMALFCAFVKNFRSIKNIGMQRTKLSYTELFFEESHLWNEWQDIKFVAIVAMLFFILELPYLISHIQSATVTHKSPELSHLEHQNSTVHVFYPLTQVTRPIENVYFWCKFCFCITFPLVTLFLRKAIRRKLNSIMSICRANSSIPSAHGSQSANLQDDSPDDFLVPQAWRRRRLSSVTSLTSPMVFGKPKSSNVQFQLLDLTTGMAKWKATYDDPKKDRIFNGRTVFEDVFDDEEEFTEFVSYQDGTEEEINSTEQDLQQNQIKKVASGTKFEKFQPSTFYHTTEDNSNILERILVKNGNCKKESKRKGCQKPRRISKSFTSNRPNISYMREHYYKTYPKLSSRGMAINNTEISLELLKSFKIKQTNSSIGTYDILPRGTAKLLDCSTDCRNIVSL